MFLLEPLPPRMGPEHGPKGGSGREAWKSYHLFPLTSEGLLSEGPVVSLGSWAALECVRVEVRSWERPALAVAVGVVVSMQGFCVPSRGTRILLNHEIFIALLCVKLSTLHLFLKLLLSKQYLGN